MGAIRVLPPEVANQIAAGEVVERPASVARELVENALDAGASRIETRIEAGGADLIEVQDNGSGMERDDALMALQRHATSKVRSVADLLSIHSFGFRGEALPSIASVSRFELRSSTGAPGAGVRVCVEGGRLLGDEPSPHPRGTTVRVESLFCTAPARRKFLRAPGTEASHVIETLTRLAAAHPAIAFRLESGGRESLHWPATAGLAGRAAQILGPREASSLVEIAHTEGSYRVTGLASPSFLHRGTPRDALLYVNRRPVRDRRLLHAVHEAYSAALPRGRFPILFLFIELPPEDVDVNVHPAKAEVRFRRSGAVHDLVVRALRRALESSRPFPELGPHPMTEGVLTPTLAEGPGSPPWPEPGGEAVTGSEEVPEPRRTPGPSPLTGAPLHPLAQYRNTYILAAAQDGLVVVDQHAAHERVLYERLLADAAAARVERQRLLFPLVLEVVPAAMTHLEKTGERLSDLGFTLTPFGAAAIRVEEVPAPVPAPAVERLIRDLMHDLAEADRSDTLEDFRHRVAALMACHAAVRAGDELSPDAMRRVVDDLRRAGSPMTCPHGRPTLIRLPLDRLEREFRRR